MKNLLSARSLVLTFFTVAAIGLAILFIGKPVPQSKLPLTEIKRNFDTLGTPYVEGKFIKVPAHTKTKRFLKGKRIVANFHSAQDLSSNSTAEITSVDISGVDQLSRQAPSYVEELSMRSRRGNSNSYKVLVGSENPERVIGLLGERELLIAKRSVPLTKLRNSFNEKRVGRLFSPLIQNTRAFPKCFELLSVGEKLGAMCPGLVVPSPFRVDYSRKEGVFSIELDGEGLLQYEDLRIDRSDIIFTVGIAPSKKGARRDNGLFQRRRFRTARSMGSVILESTLFQETSFSSASVNPISKSGGGV